jgi:hypothetical protein
MRVMRTKEVSCARWWSVVVVVVVLLLLQVVVVVVGGGCGMWWHWRCWRRQRNGAAAETGVKLYPRQLWWHGTTTQK